jgi:proteasome lid subunit RPN8/RPN11
MDARNASNLKIKKELLEMLLAISKESHPMEMVALLAGRRNVAEELIVLPFESGVASAIIHTEMLPLGMRIIGTFHSHPSPHPVPSSADLELFSRFGRYHIIVAYPYTMDSWKCYDRHGNVVEAEIID